MPKAEISWKRATEDGRKLQVYARHVGREFHFFHREKRFDQWQSVSEPPLEDWLERLAAVRRLTARRRYQPDDEERLRWKNRECGRHGHRAGAEDLSAHRRDGKKHRRRALRFRKTDRHQGDDERADGFHRPRGRHRRDGGRRRGFAASSMNPIVEKRQVSDAILH